MSADYDISIPSNDNSLAISANLDAWKKKSLVQQCDHALARSFKPNYGEPVIEGQNFGEKANWLALALVLLCPLRASASGNASKQRT